MTTLEDARARYQRAKALADAESERQHYAAEARAEEQRLARLRTRGRALGVAPAAPAPAHVRPAAPPAAVHSGRPSAAVVAMQRLQLAEQGRSALARVEAAQKAWADARAAGGVHSPDARQAWRAYQAAEREGADLIASARRAGLL